MGECYMRDLTPYPEGAGHGGVLYERPDPVPVLYERLDPVPSHEDKNKKAKD
jgi:hypothetical protein